MLAVIYAAIAYGAYLEHKENDNRFNAEHYWHTSFVFCTAVLWAGILISIFTWLGAL
jgi:hypothetical protein